MMRTRLLREPRLDKVVSRRLFLLALIRLPAKLAAWISRVKE